MRKKKPTAKKAIQRADELEMVNVQLKLTLENAQASFMENIYTQEVLFEQILEQAGTLIEARRWFKDYKSALQNVPDDVVDHKQAVIDALAEQGFHISLDEMPTGREMLDEYQRNQA